MPSAPKPSASTKPAPKARARKPGRPTALVAALVLTGTLSGPAFAQAEGGPDKPPGPPPTAEEARAERQKNSAAKLAGLVAFVRTSCPDLRPDADRFRTVLGNLGVASDDLERGDLHLRALAYTEVYAKDVPANCARATENFGPAGTTLPGLFAKP